MDDVQRTLSDGDYLPTSDAVVLLNIADQRLNYISVKIDFTARALAVLHLAVKTIKLLVTYE